MLFNVACNFYPRSFKKCTIYKNSLKLVTLIRIYIFQRKKVFITVQRRKVFITAILFGCL